MSNATPVAAIARVVLSPEMTAAQVLGSFLAGQTDAEAVRLWALDGVVDVTNPAEVSALLQMLAAGDVAGVFAASARVSKGKAERGATLRITFSDSGRVVVNGLKLNQSAEGKGGIPLSLFPAQLSTLIDALPLLLQSTIDKADASYAATEMDKIYNPAYDAAKKANASEDVLKSIPRYIDAPHKRAGKSVTDWNGCDKAATVAKFRDLLGKVRTAK